MGVMHVDDEESLEELLKFGISTYGDAEPRTGLEQRILAKLTGSQPAPLLRRWRWVVAAPAFVALLAGVLICGVMSEHATHHEPNISHSSIHAGMSTPPIAVTVKQAADPGNRSVKIRRQRRNLDATLKTHRSERLPKLNQFPSPLPPTEEERALIAFTRQHPEAGKEIIALTRRLDEPIQIAAIYIAPLNIDETQPGKKDENEE
jgi:hypothetical protein